MRVNFELSLRPEQFAISHYLLLGVLDVFVTSVVQAGDEQFLRRPQLGSQILVFIPGFLQILDRLVEVAALGYRVDER